MPYVSLTPELTALIAAKVGTERYQSVSEVVWKFARLERIRSWVDYIDIAKAEASIREAGFHLFEGLKGEAAKT